MRIIHACGMTEIARDIVMSPGFADGARSGAAGRRADPVRFQDGGQRHHARAPAGRATRSSARSTTRACPALARAHRQHPHRGGHGAVARPAGRRAVVAIGNAPTALFRLLEMLDAGAPPPAAVIGLPVGFVGAAESKEALARGRPRAVPDRARPQGRQRHGGGGGQRAGERARMTSLDDLAGTRRGGTLYGIGVGPGDVRYLTLRAAGWCARSTSSPISPRSGQRGNARRIVAPLVDGRPEREMRAGYIPSPTRSRPSSPTTQQQIGALLSRSRPTPLAAQLRQGKSVGLLAEGDPFFYGSFMHMWRRLAADFPVEVVPGVTGMSGCWTRANPPITWGNDMLTVLPGTLAEDELVERLQRTDAAVIMKVGRNLARCARAVEAAGLLARAIYVERGTMEDERILPLADKARRRGAYFADGADPGRGTAAVSAAGSLVIVGTGPGKAELTDAGDAGGAGRGDRPRRLRPLSRPRARPRRASAATPPTIASSSTARATRSSSRRRAARSPWCRAAIPACSPWRRRCSRRSRRRSGLARPRHQGRARRHGDAGGGGRVGAPLGGDFCAISLSDNLKPWATIERRLKAAAAGRFRDRALQPGLDRAAVAARRGLRARCAARGRRRRSFSRARSDGRTRPSRSARLAEAARSRPTCDAGHHRRQHDAAGAGRWRTALRLHARRCEARP